MRPRGRQDSLKPVDGNCPRGIQNGCCGVLLCVFALESLVFAEYEWNMLYREL